MAWAIASRRLLSVARVSAMAAAAGWSPAMAVRQARPARARGTDDLGLAGPLRRLDHVWHSGKIQLALHSQRQRPQPTPVFPSWSPWQKLPGPMRTDASSGQQ